MAELGQSGQLSVSRSYRHISLNYIYVNDVLAVVTSRKSIDVRMLFN